ncbi:MAG: hypothetical protein HKN54_03055 [Flavobacteriaceae bacterium]|nr:hypothetical protein [Flavobacteriaceae bacterium]
MNFNKIISELKRRNVFKAAIAYLAVSWVIIQIASIVLPTFSAPAYIQKALIYVLIIGFIFWIGFSWLYDLTPDGLKKTKKTGDNEEIVKITSQRLNKVIIGSLLVVIAILIVNQFYIQDVIENNSTNDSKEMVTRKYANSIAVMAFKDMSPNQDQEYFSDGISESIISLLTKIPELKVISSASSFNYKNKHVSIAQIADDLDVKYILDGNVKKSDSLLRITIKLIDTRDGSQIWDHIFNHNASEIFQIQDEIANSVAQHLELTLSTGKLNSASTDFESYRLFLESSYLYHIDTPESMIEADAILRKSIIKDSTYAPALILLGRIVDRRSRNFNQLPIEEGQKFVINTLEKAIKLDPNNAEAHAFLASKEALRRNFEKAQSLISKAQVLEPSNPTVIGLGAVVNFYLGNIQESIRLDHEVLAIDPLNSRNYFNIGLNYYFIHDYDNALEYLKKYDYLKPEAAIHHYITSVLLTLKGDHEAALIEAEKEPSEWANLCARSNAYYGMGEQKLSDSLLNVLINKYGIRSANSIAASHAWRNEKDEAFVWLNRALKENKVVLHESIYYPYFISLYDDPRWAEFLKNMNLPKGHFILSTLD